MTMKFSEMENFMEGTRTELQMIKMSEIQSQEVAWLWYPFIPYGKLTIVQGDPGDGKTTFVLNIAAKLSKGEGIDSEMKLTEPLAVIYQSAEDGLADTVKPRLEAAGANCENISVIDESIKSLSMIDERLEEAVIRTKAKLPILDPIQAYLGGGMDMNRANEARDMTKKLAALAEKYQCAIVLVGHMNKAAGNKAAFGHPKAFELSEDGFHWLGDYEITADEVLGGIAPKANKLEQVKRLFRELAETNNAMQSNELFSLAEEQSISRRTLENAKKELGIRAKRINNSWYWELDKIRPEYCNENVKDVYHELFDEALARYNEKQTRSDRRIDDYYEKIRSGKQEKPFHEIILQIGDKDNMGAKTENGQLVAKVLDKYMRNFQRRNPTLRVFSAYLHMGEATPHLHINFVPYTMGSKRGLDTRVSLKQAFSALGFKGGTRRETELNQWVAYEKEQLAAVMLEHEIEWEKKGTHEKHLSVLDFEKKERAKEVAELEQSITDGKERLSDIQIRQRKAEQKTEQIRQEGEVIRQEVSELLQTNNLLKEQAATLAVDKEKLLFDNEKLEKQQKKMKQEIEKMVQSKAVMERNIHAYDEDEKWQLPEPGALMSAKSYKDKKALPLVEKLKEVVKALTIKCVQLAEQGKKLKDKVTRQEQQISRLTDKVMEQSDTIDRLQEKAANLGCLERYFGREQVQSIVAV